MNEKVFNPRDIHKLEDPERLAWLPPQEVVALLGLAAGMRVADIGAGSGYFALPFARAIGPDGRLFAVDFQPEMLEFLRAKLIAPGAPGNIECAEGSGGSTGLPDASCDLVFVANVWHELDDRAAALEEAARILRRPGRIAILDWRSDLLQPPGPPPHHRIGQEETAATLESHGWTIRAATAVGRFSYLVIAAPKAL